MIDIITNTKLFSHDKYTYVHYIKVNGQREIIKTICASSNNNSNAYRLHFSLDQHREYYLIFIKLPI